MRHSGYNPSTGKEQVDISRSSGHHCLQRLTYLKDGSAPKGTDCCSGGPRIPNSPMVEHSSRQLPLLPPQDSLGTRHTHAQQAHIQVKHTAICKIKSAQSIKAFQLCKHSWLLPPLAPRLLCLSRHFQIWPQRRPCMWIPATHHHLHVNIQSQVWDLFLSCTSHTAILPNKRPAKQKATRNLPMTECSVTGLMMPVILVSIYSSL